jgi:hypothetical protein
MDRTYAATRTTTSRATGARSKSAWAPRAVAIVADVAVRTSRGGAVSAADIRVPAPTTCTTEGPNIVIAVRNAEPVSE